MTSVGKKLKQRRKLLNLQTSNPYPDLVPGEDGRWGQVIDFVHDDYDYRVQAPSFRAWFEQLVEGLEQGTIVNDEEYGLISTEQLE